nr:zinc finger, CCHC-type [Tanacetum cinerariifolium]
MNNANVKQAWKATGKVFASVGSRWKPTGRKFTLGDMCPLTWITKPEVVSLESARSVRTSEPTNNITVTPSKFDESGKGVIICLYVDDMLIFSTDKVQVDLAKEFLSSRFSMKDIGEVDGILVLEGYSEASWISNTEDNLSTSGWAILLGGGAIYWASKKQTCITSSIIESEFVVLAAAGKEFEWLRNLIFEIPLWSKPITHISIHRDSAATLEKAYSQMYNGKSRHLGVRHSMIRELIMNGGGIYRVVRSQQT